MSEPVVSAPTSVRAWLKNRLSQASDTEPEQAIKIRLTLGIGLLIYFCLPWREDQTFASTLSSFSSIVALSYYSFALMIAVAILINPKPSPIRRIMGIFLDMVSLSIVMFMAGAEAVYLFVLYLWVILGNGFRYGLRYLYISWLVAVTGFTMAITWGEYWQSFDHRPVGFSLLFLLLLIPLYAAFLINKLHAAIASAKQANEAKTRFLANMSHELRTPLNGVIGIADLMGETPLNSQQREFVHIMRNSANTLLGLIENVLDISKIEAGKITLNDEAFDLHEFVHNIIQMQRPMGQAKGLHVALWIDSQIPPGVHGDPQHLRQVLINLIGNAIKFTETGTVRLILNAEQLSEQQVRVRFDVEDTGIGIPASALPTIFDDFTQVIDSSTHGQHGGTGLGTTIAKELVQLMGGAIGVESQSGQGTRFWFTIDLALIAQQHVSISERRILLLADEDSQQTLQPAFDSWGVPYQAVSSPARAFSELLNAADQRKQAFSVVMVDVPCMQDIDAMQFAQLIMGEPTLANLSLVLLRPNRQQIARLQDFYVSSVNDLTDKPSLFNAIHAAQSVSVNDNENIIKLSRERAKPGPALKVLVAEDNQVNQQVMKGILKHAGHRMILAESGDEALDMISERLDEIDLIILDMNMPGYSGLEILKRLRIMDTQATTPVIILTADATPMARQACLDAGVDAFLTKPVQSSSLLRTIEELTSELQFKDIDAAAGPALLDQTALLELVQLGQDAHFLQRLIEGFKEDGNYHTTIIRLAAQDDYFRMRESLHAIRGSAAELSAHALVELCRQAEHSKPVEIGSPRILQLAEDIQQCYQDTVTALEQQLNKFSSTSSQ
ncbi:ATP-binding protein [Methylophaga lonarensis]|uniref:ATP-binding protein n=1 Tax=Methylophaga lonarensis TaxID=999151 RepID=UPI003D2BB3E3